MLKSWGTRWAIPRPVWFDVISVGGAALQPLVAQAGVTPPPAGVDFDYAEIEIQDNPIRIRMDGSTAQSGPQPTAGVGHLYQPGVVDILSKYELVTTWVIRQLSNNGTLVLTYYRGDR